MGKGNAGKGRRTDPAEEWTRRGRTLAVALELLYEGWRILRDLLGGGPW